MSVITDAVRDWAPGPVETVDVLVPGPAAALAGVLDVPVPGELPPLWHWLYFLDRPAERGLGPDGHPRDGHFLPPLPDRRRMWAGGRFTRHAPLPPGETVTRRSALAAVTPKTGRSGEMVFVTVRHEFTAADGTLLAAEEQDHVYRSGDPAPPTRTAPAEEPQAGPWRIGLETGPVLLFRFSALTYNAHRIHYDHAYATQEEGHAGLVVHGPLLAILLAELPRRHGHAYGSLEYRLRAPLHAGDPCTATGGPDEELRIIGPGGIHATMRLAP